MWSTLNEVSQLDTILADSHNEPIAIFKHSTTCSISGMSKMRLEGNWDIDNLKIYYLDLLNHRDISSAIASKFSVHHESPQIVLIYKGECIYDASHFDISVDELKETLSYHKISN